MFQLATSEDITYIYDGTFHGLISIFHETLMGKPLPSNIISQPPVNPGLFQDYITIDTEMEESEKLLSSIRKKFSKLSYKRLMLAFLSGAPGVENFILKYLHMGWRYGKEVDNHLTDMNINPMITLCEKVSREYHRMLGLVRFKLTGEGIYYSEICTDYNLLPLLSPHFASRMPEESWIIHDTRRKMAAKCDNSQWQIYDFQVNGPITYDRDENLYQQLWKNYFINISIEERKNKKLQRQFVPRRYWKNLVEPISI